jgi:hypothetical protein
VGDLPEDVDPEVASFPRPEDLRRDAPADSDPPVPDWHLQMREAAVSDDHISRFNNFI